jgi:alkylation response protein AidB-like acyl-CoA dehydrogenase
MDAETVQRNVSEISQRFAADRRARQMRRNLDKADFDALAAAGYLLTGVPASMGGLWTDLQSSTRPICEILRSLAQGDPSVALVSAMHPAVTGYWLANSGAELETQKRWVAQTALDGHWWGTITSEPGSGGDVMRSRAVARKTPEGGYTLSGQKHFGSGSGVSSYMMTMAIPEGEADVSLFFFDVRGVPWDGSTGMKLVAEWDGHGMIATQSHAFEFSGYPATRLAWPGNLRVVSTVAGAQSTPSASYPRWRRAMTCWPGPHPASSTLPSRGRWRRTGRSWGPSAPRCAAA